MSTCSIHQVYRINKRNSNLGRGLEWTPAWNAFECRAFTQSLCTFIKFHSYCFQAPTPKAAPTAPTQHAPPPAVRPSVPPQSLQPGLLPYGQPRAASKPTFRPAALRLDDQGREIDEFGNLVQNRTESITTLKVLSWLTTWHLLHTRCIPILQACGVRAFHCAPVKCTCLLQQQWRVPSCSTVALLACSVGNADQACTAGTAMHSNYFLGSDLLADTLTVMSTAQIRCGLALRVPDASSCKHANSFFDKRACVGSGAVPECKCISDSRC